MRDILYHNYRIQIELADLYNILCIISLGDDYTAIDRLVEALRDIAEIYRNEQMEPVFEKELIIPEIIVSPKEAFYSSKKTVKLEESVGEISGELVMSYPPGIPIIAPGEKITEEVVNYIQLLKEQKAILQGPVDPLLESIRALGF